MVDCIVCRYWSERLEEARARRRSKGTRKEENCLVAALRTHQRGACASRFPDLLKDLVKHEPKPKHNAPSLCDPVRVRILATVSTVISDWSQSTSDSVDSHWTFPESANGATESSGVEDRA